MHTVGQWVLLGRAWIHPPAAPLPPRVDDGRPCVLHGDNCPDSGQCLPTDEGLPGDTHDADPAHCGALPAWRLPEGEATLLNEAVVGLSVAGH